MNSQSISILLPLFNGAPHLPRQIDSILAQSWEDFELLIVDDGSTDDSVKVVKDHAGRDSRVRMLQSSGNRGQKERLLELLHASQAPLVAFADQDDIWHPDKLKRLAEALDDCALAYGRSELIDAKGDSLRSSLLDVVSIAPTSEDRLTYLFLPRVSGHALLARREFVTEMAFSRFQPYDWLIALDALFGRGLKYVDDAIVYHRLHDSNQYNTAPLGPLHNLKPWVMMGRLRGVQRRRFNFCERVVHLAHSRTIDGETRLRFLKLAKVCSAAWLRFNPNGTKPQSHRNLQAQLVSLLEPLAGSDRDWSVAFDQLTILAQSMINPRFMYLCARELIGLKRGSY